MPDLASLATKAALEADWQKAVDLNSAILADNPGDIEALNRLAHALSFLGKTRQAKKIYQQALTLDPYNYIAQKNLKKLSALRDKVYEITPSASSPCLFLEEPGKTKVVALVNPAPQKVLSCLTPGAPLDLSIKKHGVFLSKNGQYLGALPDDLAHRLINLARLGNVYQAHAKAIDKNNLLVFLQEVQRGKRVGDQPSFPPSRNNGFYPFVFSKQALDIDKEPPEGTVGEEEEEGTEERQEA